MHIYKIFDYKYTQYWIKIKLLTTCFLLYFLKKIVDKYITIVYNGVVKQKCFTLRMILDKSVRLCLLNDFYGALLTENQQSVLDSYLNYNMPLVEISAAVGITRQAVLDTIKKATKKLEEYESKLGMLKKYLAQKKLLENSANDELAKKILNVWRQE